MNKVAKQRHQQERGRYFMMWIISEMHETQKDVQVFFKARMKHWVDNNNNKPRSFFFLTHKLMSFKKKEKNIP